VIDAWPPSRLPCSYARWEQALQSWEKVRGECKDLARQVRGSAGCAPRL
jgi:hypothetical protein